MRSLVVALLAPAVFAAAPGWHTGHTGVHACPGSAVARCQQVSSWAATIPWRGCVECLPHRMISRLPPDGIALQVTLTVQRPATGRRALRWPPQIVPDAVVAGFEGISARYGVFQFSGTTGGSEAYGWAFFGRAHPTRMQIARANAELGSLGRHS